VKKSETAREGRGLKKKVQGAKQRNEELKASEDRYRYKSGLASGPQGEGAATSAATQRDPYEKKRKIHIDGKSQ